MNYSTEKYYQYKTFAPGELKYTIKKTFELLNVDSIKEKITLFYKLENGTEYNEDLYVDDMNNITEIKSKPSHINFHYFNREMGNTEFSIVPRTTYLIIRVSTSVLENTDIIYNSFKEGLKLQELSKDELEKDNISCSQEFDNIKERISNLEKVVYNNTEKIRCFISYRFYKSEKNIVYELTRFLNLLGIEVITGMGYEPRRISEKVLSKLDSNINFIIYLVTNIGESMWTRDEISVSFAKDRYIVPLIEKGTKFQTGIFADLEYIEFENGHISDTYISLLEAIKFIKEDSNSKKESNK